MDFSSASVLLQLIVVDIILSGDNALVIALACRSLPAHQQRVGVLLGTGAAVGLRIAFATVVTFLLQVPYLGVVGGLMLLWVAYKLLRSDSGEGHEGRQTTTLLGALTVIAAADAAMSLDNVLAIAAIAKGDILMLAFGLVLSIPLVVFGATILMKVIERLPILVWAGAALIAWIGVDLATSDPHAVALAERLLK